MIADMDPIGSLLDALGAVQPATPQTLRRLKIRFAPAFGGRLMRNDALLARYREDLASGRRASHPALEQSLMLNRIRSESGLATVTVVTEPYACPGRCVYCPTEANAPKSYLTNEPAVLRALRNDYDPYRQVVARLLTLHDTGHPTDKIELIIKGGTWSFYPARYQQTFIQRCFEAANDFPGQQGHRGDLSAAQQANETAGSRIIGITIETRPDYVDECEVTRLREFGVTRVELGVQSLEDRVLDLTVRDHGTAEIRAATALLRDAGLKIAYHIMPNLPGATQEDDLATMRTLFANPSYRPDTLKLYPCVVIQSAELFDWWRAGRYTPYDDETLVALLIRMKQEVPSYVRIERVIRDIPSTSIEAGSHRTNLRQEVQRQMRLRGLTCRCIRCRQVREPDAGPFVLCRTTYEAGGGTEIFLSFENPRTDRLGAFLRLRIPSPAQRARRHWLPALEGAALIRELHTYGQHLRLAQRRDEATQHQGFGRRLMEEAERIAQEEFGVSRIAAIAGVGVREYYRRLGYRLVDTYMIKTIRDVSWEEKNGVLERGLTPF